MPLDPVLDDRAEQILLRREVPVDGARADAGPAGDLVDRHRQPLGGEGVVGDLEHAGAVAGRVRAQRPVGFGHITPREWKSGAHVPYSRNTTGAHAPVNTLPRRSHANWTTADIPDQTGRTAVITGANTGLGYETAAALAAKGAHVVLAVRNLDKGQAAADRIGSASPGASVAVQELDLTSLDSIRAPPTNCEPTYDAIDLLINNAGVMLTPKSTTKDGFELQFGTNHLGHFAFTGLLLDHVLAAPGSRVVTVSSVGHRFVAAASASTTCNGSATTAASAHTGRPSSPT